ncbi:MAG: hypothetical protein H3C39_07580 [Flavobacteriia bacterium]|nr:hypothetical protein [Flavobacteriia bacterium]
MRILFYILKVWLLTMVFAPIAAFAIDDPGKDYWYVYIVVLSTSLLLSIPAVIAMVAFLNFAPLDWGILKVKIVNSLVAIAGIFITFRLMDKTFLDFSERIVLWPLSYALIMVLFIFIFKLKRENPIV